MANILIIDFYTSSDDALRATALQMLQTSTIPNWQKHIWEFLTVWLNNESDTIQVTTSGSTGPAKVIRHTKQAIKASALRTCRTLNLLEGSIALLCLPANKIAGMMMIVRSHANKMKLYCIEPSQNPLQSISANPVIHFAAFTPSQIYSICNTPYHKQLFASIHNVILGGGEVTQQLLKTLQTLPNNTYSSFGMTETISHIALKKISDRSDESYFTAFKDVEIKQDDRGCLIITDHLLGIKNIVTNDVVTIHSENTFEWHGRYDFIINTGGIKVNAEELERKIHNLIRLPYFFTGTAHPQWGEQITLVIQSKALSKTEIQCIKDSIETLDKIQQPKQIWLCPKFVYTDTKKLNRIATIQRCNIKLSTKDLAGT